MSRIRSLTVATALAITAMAASPVWAALTAHSGAYHISLSSQPPVIAVGRARFALRLTDTTGKPVAGARMRILARMPGMNMGEKETSAAPDPASPGSYTADAVFMMAGDYVVRVSVENGADQVTMNLPLATGQDTTVDPASRSPLSALLPWIIAAIGLVVTVLRMRTTGQRIAWRSILSRGAIGGVALTATMVAGSIYAVNHWRRAGAMTPVEAQAMEMNTPAPPGVIPVTLDAVTRGPVASGEVYTGQAVAYSEVDVMGRVQGWLRSVDVYVADSVRRGQTVAVLDMSESGPVLRERAAGVTMAGRGVETARREAEQSRAELLVARASSASADSALAEARANLTGAAEEEAASSPTVQAAQGKVVEMEAQERAAGADQSYWSREILREKSLLDRGVVSREEYERELAQAEAARSREAQAQAALTQARAEVRAAEAMARRAGAMRRAAEARVQGAVAEVATQRARVASSQQAVATATQRTVQMAAAVPEAHARLEGAAARVSWSTIAAPIDGVVTARLLSPGQLAAPGQPILRVAQVSPIRIQAVVPQSAMAGLRVGMAARVRAGSDSGRWTTANITALPASIDPASRTGIVEMRLANPGRQMMPGQSVSVQLGEGSAPLVVRVPAAAVVPPVAGSAPFVWVADPIAGQPGQYAARRVEVRTGVIGREFAEIIAGVTPGQRVVADGAGVLRPGDILSAPKDPVAAGDRGGPPATSAERTVEVSSHGYTPDTLELPAGAPVRLTFIRLDEQNCGNEIAIPAYGIRRALPLRQRVTIEITPRQGSFTFTCGMGMLHGKLVVR